MATQIARYVKEGKHNLPRWNSPHQSLGQTQGQLAWYIGQWKKIGRNGSKGRVGCASESLEKW